MNELSYLLNDSEDNQRGESSIYDEDMQWGGTPGLRKVWLLRNLKRKATLESDAEEILPEKNIFEIDCESSTLMNEMNITEKKNDFSLQTVCVNCLSGTPGLLIATMLNLFLSMSFGQAFFPSNWEFPPEVPRSIGVQMFLLSTLICQLVMTAVSDFPTAMGMMMVENIPFMHIIADITLAAQGPGIDSFSTLFVAFSISTIVVGVFFYLLGKFKIGNAVYFFPRHVIIGCIGGIGIFIIQTGVEVSTNTAWQWSITSVPKFLQHDIAVHWLASLGFAVVLRIIQALFNAPLIPPFYFVSIPPVFYAILTMAGISVHTARQYNWFFPQAAETVDATLIWRLIDFSKVNWSVIGNCIPTIIALTIFSLMHVPINIPSLSMSTHRDVDMNKELIAHGYANLLSGLCGGLQNYLCYSNSLLYYKCKGGGKISGYLLSAIVAVFFYIGPSVVSYMPRAMPGCLLIHIGIDLSSEALYDSWDAFDSVEYASIVAITVVMTFYGMTAGLGLGVICAALTFTIQASRHVTPIRGKMCACTLRSSHWRAPHEAIILDDYTRHIVAIQLQGHLFFGNATLLAAEVEKMLLHAHEADKIWFIILDFTLVVGIDSSAADTLLKISKICRRHNVRLCYSAGSAEGFPCSFKLSEAIGSLDIERIPVSCTHCTRCGAYYTLCGGQCTACGKTEDCTRSKWVCIANNLNQALAWCEDVLIAEERLRRKKLSTSNNSNNNKAVVAATSVSTSAVAKIRSSKEIEDETTTTIAHYYTNGTTRQQQYGTYCSSGNSSKSTTSTTSSSLENSPIPRKGLVVLTNKQLQRELGVIANTTSLPLIPRDVPPYLHQIYTLCSDEPREVIEKLLSYFVLEQVATGTVLWVQGSVANSAVLLVSGRLEHLLEDEAETKENVHPGHLVGEYGLINKQHRLGTLTVVEESSILVLHSKCYYEKIIAEEPYLAFVLSKICMAYLGRRVMHVANRIWESRCLPV